ncbi:MAG: type II toxin-antitoxin system RelE/ParE family toxin [Lachnospiraceae bacterium]
MFYKLIVTKPAESDLSDILQYISKDLSAPKAASEFLDEVLKCYDNISENPLMYALCDNDRLKNKKYRKAIIKNYIMFYRVDEENHIIYIMRFIYGRRDYIRLI